MKTRKTLLRFTKQITSLCKTASLLLTAAALTVSMGPSLTTVPNKAFAADSTGSEAAAVRPDIVALKTQAYDWGRVKIVGGGFISGIIFNEKEKDLIYARTDMGGAYRWDPATKTWIQLMDWVSLDEWNLSGVESLATDPVDPNRVYIAAGTYSNDWVQSNGYILRSQDRGQTWEKTEMPFKFGGNMPGRSMGERLAVDPNDNRILYLGARNGNGLWKSEDYGATWHKVSSFTPVGDVKDDYGGNVGPVWVTFDPTTGSAGHATQTIYVGLADTQTSIYKSVDGGATWEPVAGQPKQGFLPHHGTLGSNGMLYVSYNSTIGPYLGGNGAIWKLDTKTGEWTDISPGGAGNTNNPYGGLAVDAQHPDTLMVATMNNWWPENSIYRSTDGGKTWNSLWQFTSYPKRDNRYTIDYSISPWLDWGIQRDPETDPETSPKLGWMIGDMEIDPFNSDRIMYGTGATLFGSENMTDLDKGEKIRISVMANGIEETAILGLISPPSGAPLISAMGDIGGFRHEDLNTAPHMITNPYIGTSNDLDYAETNPNLIVRVGHASNQDARMGVSTDNGVTWTPAANAWQAEDGDNTSGGWVTVGANGQTIVWAPEGNAVRPVSFSTDLGKTWTASKGIPQGAVVSSDRINPDKFYGFHEGKFYVSTDGGANFTASAASGLPNNLNGKFKAAPTTEGDIWLASAEGLFRSTDSGASFEKVVGVDEAVSVGFGKEAPGKSYKTIYAGLRVNGGKFGFYRSEDEGASWIRINDDQHQFANARGTITGDGQVYGRVYIGTNGMGIVRGDIKQGATVQGFHVNDLTVEAGKSAALAPVFDGGASSRPVVWSSSDASVATVSGDQVTGLEPGTAAIAAVSEDGQYAATAVVTVTPAMPMREITADATIQLEAEQAELSGGINVNTDHPGYTGSGFVDGYWNFGGKATFTVNVPAAGNYKVTARYGNAAFDPATVSLIVNGTKIKQTSLPLLANWDTWGNQTETVTLNAGVNTIAYKYDTGDTGIINLDHIRVSPAPIEAETATRLGFAAVYNDSSASGGQAVEYLHVGGNGIQFNNVPAATSLTVRYAATNSGTYSMYVNGIKTKTISFTGNGTWNGAYTSVTVPVNIPAGATLKLQYDAGDTGWNVDYIIVQ